MRRAPHAEAHKLHRSGWLRAAVLGADDAICSTASLMIGVAASSSSNGAILTAGVAGLAAGAMSMAVGEYVSVSAQRDAERGDLTRERRELASQPEAEMKELAMIYERRGLGKELARQVAEELSAHDPLGTHAREELGIDPNALARPLQAAAISAASFAVFGLVPIAALLSSPASLRIGAIAVLSLVGLATLGAIGGRLGGAPPLRAAVRVTLGGSFAMAVTAAIGWFLGALLQ
jgi:VIT1/CCC1 family predicted Fe2+/Mn2+ transporter